MDRSDLTVGTIGLLNAGASYYGLGYPVIGEGVALYSWTNMWLNLGYNYGPSNWFAPKPQESIILEYMRRNGL